MKHYWKCDPSHYIDLADLVVPDDPAVDFVMGHAALNLQDTTHPHRWPTFEAAVKSGHNRGAAEAVYNYLKSDCYLTYAHEAAYHAASGQRIRTPKEVLDNHHGTCLDLAVLFMSCLANQGIPHAYVHVRTPDRDHALVAILPHSSPSELPVLMTPKELHRWLDQTTLIECTGFVEGPGYNGRIDFKEATKIAIELLTVKKFPVVFALNILAAKQATDRDIEICRHNAALWRKSVPNPIDEPGRSQRRVVRAVLNALCELVDLEPYHPQTTQQAMTRFVADIIDARPDYALLSRLLEKIDDWYADGGSQRRIRAELDSFASGLRRTLGLLALNGAKALQPGDTVLLYAHSETVSAAIDDWLDRYKDEELKLVYCQCLWKRSAAEGAWEEPLRSANDIRATNARITFVTDSGAASLLKQGIITKVMFGAYGWGRESEQGAWFRNTPGTFAIASVATRFDVPIYVLTELRKGHSGSPFPHDNHVPAPILDEALPMQTDFGLSIGYSLVPEDTVYSSDIPFSVITESGEQSFGDFDLHKRNRVIPINDTQHVVKRTTDRASALSERAVLRALNKPWVSEREFKVPAIGGRSARSPEVAMVRIDGVRVHDLLASANILARVQESQERASQVKALKEYLLAWSISDVKAWQTEEFKQAIRRELRSVWRNIEPQGGGNTLSPADRTPTHSAPYPFRDKLAEAVKAVDAYAGEEVLRESQRLAESLEARSAVHMRDATLKNQMIELSALSMLAPRGGNLSAPYYPGADCQWHDIETVAWLLDNVPTTITWSDLKARRWNVDFESARWLTTAEDDYVHILAMQVIGLEYEDIIRSLKDHLPNEDAERFHETIFFRCFRAWARRLAYIAHRPDLYSMRYRHESLGHYHGLTLTAGEQLRSVGICEQLVELAHQLGPCGG